MVGNQGGWERVVQCSDGIFGAVVRLSPLHGRLVGDDVDQEMITGGAPKQGACESEARNVT